MESPAQSRFPVPAFRRAGREAARALLPSEGPDAVVDAVADAVVDAALARLAGGVTEYAVQPHIDGRVGNLEEYGTERDALLLRLEQPEPDGYRLTVLTRQVVRTEWSETGGLEQT